MVSVGVDCAPEGERDQMATKRLANIVFVSEWSRGLTGLRRLSKLMTCFAGEHSPHIKGKG